MSEALVNAIKATNGTGNAIELTSASNTCTANITNYPHRNALINGGMQVAQYASTNSAINTYGPLDRWRTFGGPMGFTISQVTDATSYPNTHYALKAHRTAGNTQEYDLGVCQGIETINSRCFAGKQVTLSFRAKVGANFSGPSSFLKAAIFTGTGTNDNPVGMTGQASTIIDKTVSTTATKYSITHTIPSSTTQITCAVYYQCRGTAGAQDWFEVTDLQLELGPAATDFEFKSYSDELERCKRYCQVLKAGGAYTRFSLGYSPGSTDVRWFNDLRPEMRATPSFAHSGNFSCQPGSSFDMADVSLESSSSSPQMAILHTSGNSGMTAGEAVSLHANADATAKITFSAEL